MAVLIVPEVVRVTINSTGLRPQANVTHFYLQGTPSETNRDETCALLASHVLEWWNVNVRPPSSIFNIWESVSYLDLDNEFGATGTVTTGSGGGAWPLGGDATGEGAATNTAYLVRHRTAGGRGARNGRTYVPGLTEGQKDGSLLLTTFQADLQDAWGPYAETLTTDVPGTTGWTMQPCTVLTLTRDSEGRPLTGTGNPILSSSVDRLLATQRRRMRG